MTAARRTQILIAILGLAGLSWCIALFTRYGIKDILSAVVAAGWGVALVVLFHIVPMLCDVLSWRILIPPGDRLKNHQLFLIRWMGDAVNSMLPVAQVGGEIVRMRVANLWGMIFPIAAATVLADMTLCVLTQILFALSGLWLFLHITGKAAGGKMILLSALLGLLAVGGFYAVQRAGIFRIGGAIISGILKSPAWQKMAAQGQSVDRAIAEIYSRRRALLISALCLMGTWSTGAVEVWIALRALGYPISYAKSYVIESANQLIRSVLFMLPGALGAQEGGYLAVGAMLGISHETALALALIRRVREISFGLTGLALWQWTEWRCLGQGKTPEITPLSTVVAGDSELA